MKKNLFSILCFLFSILYFLFLSACQAPSQEKTPDDHLLAEYAKQTDRTDPGRFEYLLDDLPESLDDICRLIKGQLIHPFEAQEMGMDIDKLYKDGDYPTVESMLGELVKLNKKGLVDNRKVDEKLVLACYHHAILMASLLRHQGISVRIRAGYSRFFEKDLGVRFGHFMCEVWDKKDKRWIRVDPDRSLVNMHPNQFEVGPDAWFNQRKGRVKQNVYTTSVGPGMRGAVYLLLTDASMVTGEEKLYFDLPELVLQDFNDFDDLDEDILEQLDDLASLLKKPDSNIDSIDSLYKSEKLFQPAGLDYEAYYKIVSEGR